MKTRTEPSVPGSELAGGPALSEHEFRRLRDLVRRHTGIALSDHKHSLVASRLGKRLRALALASFGTYCDYLESEAGHEEREHFINAITTNKTEFFREVVHFDFLTKELLPRYRARGKAPGPPRLRLWSAGCSTGEEAYTLAMTLRDALDALAGWDVRILASDIDTQVLAEAEAGVYPADRVAALSQSQRQRHLLRGTGASAHLVKVRDEVRRLITFRRINLLDERWPIRTRFDCIFCRNVLIYFDKATQSRIINRFADYLVPGGHLFLGHSESMYGLSDRFAFVRNAIYRHAAPALHGSATAAGRPG